MERSRRYMVSAVAGCVLGVLLGAQPATSTPITAVAQVGPGPDAGSGSHASAVPQSGDTRAGEGGLVPTIALRSADSLSDTKIFVLLAAIVFVFLLALGVAMTRVSRGRMRQHDARMRHQLAGNVPPPTLNKTILDVLPVFEVTAKRQLRQLHTGSPQALGECFNDGTSTCSLPPGECVGSTSQMPRKMYISACGYGLDSGNASLCSEAMAGKSYGSDASVLTGNMDAVELAAWPGDNKPMPPPPAMFRRHGSSATPESAYTDLDTRATPDRAYANINMRVTPDRAYDDLDTRYADVGAVTFRARSTRSLDLTPEHESVKAGRRASEVFVAQSQPEIGRRASADDDAGLGACPICLEEFEAGEHLRELPCRHRYHLMCIDTWLVSRSTCCPYCKLDIRRWYNGPELDDAIPRVRPDAPLIDQIPDRAPRTLQRIERHTGSGRFMRALRAMRNALD
ncbi:hypothetical protein IWW50_001018 [Coemansia erecta]|nr:hypothetical protein GGF43_002228 [Coemansia sp. RSA 2618]KAJ2829143.1 hypothetical protein IWW50_001018 [Coemansia erecta]